MKFNKLTVKHLMNTLNYKQKQMAEELGMSEAAFSAAMKSGGMADDRVILMAKLLCVDIRDLMNSAERVNIVMEQSGTYHSTDIEFYKSLIKSKDDTIESLKETILSLKREIALIQEQTIQKS